jgi:hypothetical protein
MRVSKALACAVVAFSVALAVVVGNRMSAEAMAVVIGVVCGVAASIPMSGVILALSRQRRPEVPAEPRTPAGPAVYLVAPGSTTQPVSPWPDYGRIIPTSVMPAPREYRVIGGDERLG